MGEAEKGRLDEDGRRAKNWKRWGPYLSERQWATVREDYSPDGSLWESFPYEHSLSRAYRWGEDGLLGIADRECRLCFALALWNGRDPHLKERLFGLGNHEGNHGEDAKEAWFYLDATPTHSYLKALYKYPQAEYPYARLRQENRERGRHQPEFELPETGVFDQGRYWDIQAEYAKASPDDILIRLTASNRGPETATLRLLPTLWFRNTWSWGSAYEEGGWAKPRLSRLDGGILADHQTLGRFLLRAEGDPQWGFTENETDPRVFGQPQAEGPRKGALHEWVVDGKEPRRDAGTKAAALFVLEVPAGQERTLRLRLTAEGEAGEPFGDFDEVFARRIAEAEEFYAGVIPANLQADEKQVCRQAYAGLLWSEQFYHYVVPDWIDGDPPRPLPPQTRQGRINRDWRHLFSRDIMSVPDKWEYPAFFAWDLAFHMVPMAAIDPAFAKGQLQLLLREWYIHPNGQIPAFEYDLSNVNPPVHAWACWQVYQRSGGDDRLFLERCFHKLLLNFTWWVNRKDPDGRGVFSGGFLGMDNLGVFDRSLPLPTGGTLEQADGTAWMGFFCTTMLRIAIELAMHSPAYEDIASKFFEHFVFIADSLNNLGGTGLWDEQDGFYYDQMKTDGGTTPIKLRGLVGFIPLLAVLVLDEEKIRPKLPELHKRVEWFMAHRRSLFKRTGEIEVQGQEPRRRMLFSLPGKQRLERALGYLFDEAEFLSPHGVRSLSRVYAETPYEFRADGRAWTVAYSPGDMETGDFGGNSNWRGPVWMPINFLLLQALSDYCSFYGDSLKAECPKGSGRWLDLDGAAHEIAERLASLFAARLGRTHPCLGAYQRFADDPHWQGKLLFPEYFHGDDGHGLGATHQTGWTALIATLIEDCARRRSSAG